jgi:hypothetical protein
LEVAGAEVRFEASDAVGADVDAGAVAGADAGGGGEQAPITVINSGARIELGWFFTVESYGGRLTLSTPPG